jgi:hypothetical protein
MKPLLTSDLKLKFLGITPLLKDRGGILNPQEIVALSGLATFRGRHIQKLKQEIEKKGGNLEKTIKGILLKSSLIGHASIATTPALCLTYEGSKFLDWALTGIVFSSSMVSSGRRTTTTERDIIYPKGIYNNKKAKELYSQVSKENIRFHNYLLSQGISKDEARRVLQQGIYGTGILQLPIESIIAVKREYEAEKEWMPEEVGILLKKIERTTKKLGIDWLYTTRETAPRNVYPYPNIFKNPAKSNLVRELRKKEKLIQDTKLISMDTLITNGLKKRLLDFGKKRGKTISSLKQIKKEWFNLLNTYQEIFRDYNSALRFRILSNVPVCIWTDKKRHRTVPQIAESIYYCVDRAVKRFLGLKSRIQEKKINNRLVEEIEEVFSISPSIKDNPEFLSEYLLTVLRAFEGYQDLLKLGVKPREAIFLIPRGVKIDVLQDFDLYNLLAGYYPLRLCATVDYELRCNSFKEIEMLKKIFKERGYSWLNRFIGPKCEIIGFCPEVKSCGYIKKLVKNYNEKFHQEMQNDLRERLEKNFKNLGK